MSPRYATCKRSTASFWQKDIDNINNPYYYIYNLMVRISFWKNGVCSGMKRIESRGNGMIKEAKALAERRERDGKRLFCFEGVHLLEECLRSETAIKTVFVRDGCAAGSALALSSGAEVISVPEQVYEKLTSEKAPQGVFTVAEYPRNVRRIDPDNAKEAINGIGGCSVILDSLQDSGNVGTIIRTACALGAAVILAGECADALSMKTVRASMGAVFFADILVFPDTVGCIRAIRGSGRRVLAAALRENGEVLGSFAIKENDCFVIGNEGAGIGEEALNECDGTVEIPMTDGVESLNASAAAAMILWEAGRGRL